MTSTIIEDYLPARQLGIPDMQFSLLSLRSLSHAVAADIFVSR